MTDIVDIVYGKLKTKSGVCKAGVLNTCEFLLSEKLKSFCDNGGKEVDVQESGKVIHQLGCIYRQRSPNKTSLIKSAVLLNAAIVRKPDNVNEIEEELSQLCAHVLELADVKSTELVSLVDKAKLIHEELDVLRKTVDAKLCKFNRKFDTVGRVQEMEQLQEFIYCSYIKIMNELFQFCIDIKGSAPCGYVLVGTGCLARKEAVPFSSFLGAILLEDNVHKQANYEEILEYFRWVSTMFQIVLANLGETVIPLVNLPYLNSPFNDAHQWFDDVYTKRGIGCDGIIPSSLKNVRGRAKTVRKHQTIEEIKPVHEMLKHFEIKENVQGSYHPDVLMQVCFVSGHKKLYDRFYQELCMHQISLKASDLAIQVQEDINNFNFVGSLAYFESRFDLRRVMCQSTGLFINVLQRLNNFPLQSSFSTLQHLAEANCIDEDFAHELLCVVAVEYEICLRSHIGKDDWQLYSNHLFDQENLDLRLVKLLGVQGSVQYLQTVLKLQRKVGSCLNLSDTLSVNRSPHLDRLLACHWLKLNDLAVIEAEMICFELSTVMYSESVVAEIMLIVGLCLFENHQYSKALRCYRLVKKLWSSHNSLCHQGSHVDCLKKTILCLPKVAEAFHVGVKDVLVKTQEGVHEQHLKTCIECIVAIRQLLYMLNMNKDALRCYENALDLIMRMHWTRNMVDADSVDHVIGATSFVRITKNDESSIHDADKELTSTTHWDYLGVKEKYVERQVKKIGVVDVVVEDMMPTTLTQRSLIMQCSFKSLTSLFEDVTDELKWALSYKQTALFHGLAEILATLNAPDLKPPVSIMDRLTVTNVYDASKAEGELQTHRIKIILCKKKSVWNLGTDKLWEQMVIEAESGLSSNKAFLTALKMVAMSNMTIFARSCSVKIEMSDSLQDIVGRLSKKKMWLKKHHRELRWWYKKLRRRLLSYSFSDQDYGVTNVDTKSSVSPISTKDDVSSVQDEGKGLTSITYLDYHDIERKTNKHPITKSGVESDVGHDEMPTNLKQPVIMKCSYKSLPSLLEDIAEIVQRRLYPDTPSYESAVVFCRALAEVLVALLEPDMKPLEPIMKHLMFEPVDVSSKVEGEQQTERIKIIFCEVRESERWKHLIVEAACTGSSNESFLTLLLMAVDYIRWSSRLDNLVEIEINDSLQKIIGDFRQEPNFGLKLSGDHLRWFSSLSEELRQRKVSRQSRDQPHGVPIAAAKTSVVHVFVKNDESSFRDAAKEITSTTHLYHRSVKEKYVERQATKIGVGNVVGEDMMPTTLTQISLIMQCSFKSLTSLFEDVTDELKWALSYKQTALFHGLAEILATLNAPDLKPPVSIMDRPIVANVYDASKAERKLQSHRIKISLCKKKSAWKLGSDEWEQINIEAESGLSSNKAFLSVLKMVPRYHEEIFRSSYSVKIEINNSLQDIIGRLSKKEMWLKKHHQKLRWWYKDLRRRRLSYSPSGNVKIMFDQDYDVTKVDVKSSVNISSEDAEKGLTSTTHLDYHDIERKATKHPVTKFGVESEVGHDVMPTNLKQPVIMKCSFKSLPSLLEDVTDIKQNRSLKAAIEFCRALAEVLVALLEPDMKPIEPIMKHLMVEPVDVSSKVEGKQQTQRVKITLCEERYGWRYGSDQRNELIIEAESGANSNEGFLTMLVMVALKHHTYDDHWSPVKIEIGDSLQKAIGECDDRTGLGSGFGQKFHRSQLWLSSLREELLQKKVSLPFSAHKVPTDTSSESSKDFLSETSVDSVETSQLQGTKIIDRHSSVVGPAGGVVKVGGCQLLIPDGALDSKVTIKLESVYEGNDEMDLLTPILKCEPHGLKFLKNVVILLNTCYINDVPAIVEVRRSEDGVHWENIKQFHHTDDRFFEFFIKGFSWFSTFFANRQRRRKSRLRKSLTFWIPSDSPASVTQRLRCYVDDDIPGVRRALGNPEVGWSLPFFAKKNEENVEISLSLEDPQQSSDLTILPASRDVYVYQKPQRETSFLLKWQKQNGELYAMNLSVETTIDRTPQPFYIRSPQPASVEEHQPSGNPTGVTNYNTTISCPESVAVGTYSTLNMPSPSTDNSSEQ